MPVRFITSHFKKDLGIDLGTANCLVYERNKGIIIREPSVVAIRKNTREVLAVGNEARQMLGRTPGDILAIRPLRNGVIADFEVTKEMLKHLIRKACKGKVFIKPRTVVSIPSGTTDVERRAVIEATLYAGAREVYLIEEPVAAAIGAGLPVHDATGNMIIDIGGGTSDMAVISMGGIVSGQSIHTGGDVFDHTIIRYIRRHFNLIIGERTAEDLKIYLGSAYPIGQEITYEVRGRDQVSGLPKVVSVTSRQIREALKEPLETIINAARMTLERTPPELVADVMFKEIVLTGGGALLKGLDKLISVELGMPVKIVDDPLSSVAIGTGMTLEQINLLSRVLVAAKKANSK
ncbi:MAG TPA: rod shape-determining protein [Bacillota bacterium]|jgi:rod shape-determining protein MreB|nr:rod shape-determining protein [Bacillota bacterium]HOL10489.1 rod shape-determining protein [Bacillota bacterium]HPO98224.1 rod shape-determining protein [Bacillota bacterium]